MLATWADIFAGHRHSGHPQSSFRRRPESRGVGEGNVARGLVPRWGGAWAWQNPPREFAAQNWDSVYLSLGVPAAAGMGDWYENNASGFGSGFDSPQSPQSSFRRRPESRGAGKGNVARSKTTRGEGHFPRSGQTGNQSWSRSTVEKTRHPVAPISIPPCAGHCRHQRPLPTNSISPR